MSRIVKKSRAIALPPLGRMRCPACEGSGKTHSHSRSITCPWCRGELTISFDVASAFMSVRKAMPFEFTIAFGGLKRDKNQERLQKWLSKGK